MKYRMIAVLLVSFLLITAQKAFSQGQPASSSTDQEASDLQWLYGQVSSIDINNKEITVKSPDYETAQDKEMRVIVNEKTIYENATSLLDIKPDDMVSMDYRTNSKGENVAERISVEKPQNEHLSQPEQAAPPEVGEENEISPKAY